MPDTYLVFRSASQLYAIAVTELQEVVHVVATAHLPGQPAILHGFLNLRGRMIPVVRLDALFGRDAREPGLYAPFIVLGHREQQIALLADAVEEVREVAPDALQPVGPGTSPNDCACAQLATPAGMAAVLSTPLLLLAKERQCIAALQRQVENRLAGADAPA